MDKLAKGYTAESEEVRSDESVALLYLLAKGYRDEGEREAIMSEFLTLKEFGERYGLAVGDPEVRRRYDLYVEGELEDRAVKRQAREEGLAEGRAEGLAEGRAEGLAEGRESLAARLRKMGVDEGILERALAESRG